MRDNLLRTLSLGPPREDKLNLRSENTERASPGHLGWLAPQLVKRRPHSTGKHLSKHTAVSANSSVSGAGQNTHCIQGLFPGEGQESKEQNAIQGGLAYLSLACHGLAVSLVDT